MKAKQLVAALFAALFIIIAGVYVLRYSQLFGNILFLLPPLLAVVCGGYAVRAYRLTNVRGKSTALLTSGLFCFFIGEVLFFLFQFVFHTSPFPSVADIFYLSAYPLLLAGLLKEISLHPIKWRELNKFVLVVILLLVLALAFIVSYFGIFLAYNPGDPVANNIIAIAYGIGDLLLIIPGLFTLNTALDYRGGALFNSWTLILVALIFMMAGDILFAIFNNQYAALIWPYTLIDLLWVVSYLCFAYSFFYTATTIKELGSKLRK
jgi:ABC-type multidrug transport system fused ATPase/permease subunit